MYALRAGFVLALLVNLTVVWWAQVAGRNLATIPAQAQVGYFFFVAIAGTVLSLVCLAAPAATAGAFCLDRAHGTLEHLFVSDLSDTEIVLGKLAAKLVPAVGLVASTVPVMALGSLLGGIDPQALLGVFLVTLGCAVGSCTVALFFSIWASKAHEALLATYAVGILWIAALPLWMIQPFWGLGVAPVWLGKSNPFWLIFGPALPIPPVATGLDPVSLIDQVVFLAGSLLISAALVAIAVARLRLVALREERPGARRWSWKNFIPRRVGRWVLGPSLDGNPVLWREWFRQRPSRWARAVWTLYAVVAGLFSLAIIMQNMAATGPVRSPFGVLFNAAQVTTGLLLLSVYAATSLAEERVQSNLDMLLTTPLSTREIVWGKWWGAFRTVPKLAILPGLVAIAFAWHNPARWPAVLLVIGLILAQGAAITSLGLALATWVPNLGRAVALTVTIYVVVTVGWVFLVFILFQNHQTLGPVLASASPLVGTLLASLPLASPAFPYWPMAYAAAGFWIVVYTGIALILRSTTLASFERCLGRMAETTKPPRPPVTVPPLLFKDRMWEWS
jgi:ABC-type transport system involved in multi-copper enzyme maturation permease subunit